MQKNIANFPAATLLLTFKTRTLKYLIALIAFTISIYSQAQAVKVEVRQTPNGWEMLRDGKPYYVKGDFFILVVLVLNKHNRKFNYCKLNNKIYEGNPLLFKI